MLVAFLGSPCSGKTTTAARLFASLKEGGFATEFYPEYARQHIALLRSLSKGEPVVLTEADQIYIAGCQLDGEEITKNACDDLGIAVTDSCVLNTLMYMRDEESQRHLVKAVPDDHYDLVFVCDPIPDRTGQDPNRVHTYAQSLELHAQLPALLKQFVPGLIPILLTGSPEKRSRAAFDMVTAYHLGR